MYNARIVKRELRLLHGLLGNSDKASKLIELEVWAKNLNSSTGDQELAINKFVENESAIYALVRKSVYDYYEKCYAFGVGNFSTTTEQPDTPSGSAFPKISIGNELDTIAKFANIYVHPTINGETVIGVTLDAEWDKKHGVGVLLHETSVKSVGIAHEAYLDFS